MTQAARHLQQLTSDWRLGVFNYQNRENLLLKNYFGDKYAWFDNNMDTVQIKTRQTNKENATYVSTWKINPSCISLNNNDKW